MSTLPLQRIEVERQRGDERLALPRSHLGDISTMEHHAANHLHVIVTQANGALGRLPNRRKSLDQDIVQRLALGKPPAEFIGLGFKFGVVQQLQCLFKRVDLLDSLLQSSGLALIKTA